MWWIVLAGLCAHAAPEQEVTWSTGWEQPRLGVAYRTGVLPHQPGLDVEFLVDGITKSTVRRPERGRLSERVRRRHVAVGGELFVDSQLTNNTFLGLTALARTGVVRTRGYASAWTVGLGVQRSFLNHVSWFVDDDGEAFPLRGVGQVSGVLSLAHEWAIDLHARAEHRVRLGKQADAAAVPELFVRPRLTGLLGWSGAPFPVPTVSLDVGVRTRFGGA